MQLTTLALFGILTLFSLLQAAENKTISRSATTEATGNDVDDCAIWIHPTDAQKSVVIVNDKGPETGSSGLYVYALDGTLLQMLPVHQPQNPDLRYGVVFNSDTMDILVCIDRELDNADYNKLRVFRINPAQLQAESGFLTEITDDAGIPSGQNEPYGHSLYQRPSDGALFSVVSNYSRDDFTQIRLFSNNAGKVTGTIVRRWGKNDVQGAQCEGICCDDNLGYIYICDEDKGVLKYYADPDSDNNSLVDYFAEDDGIISDREGISIYSCNDSSGYILLSSQGNNQIKVYDRRSNLFLGTVHPEGMQDCDGLDVTALPAGENFPYGFAAFHLGSLEGSSFGLYNWAAIADVLSLDTPCTAPPTAITLLPQSSHSHYIKSPQYPFSITMNASPTLHCRKTGVTSATVYSPTGVKITTIVQNKPVCAYTVFPIPPLASGFYILNCSSSLQNNHLPLIIP